MRFMPRSDVLSFCFQSSLWWLQRERTGGRETLVEVAIAIQASSGRPGCCGSGQGCDVEGQGQGSPLAAKVGGLGNCGGHETRDGCW